MLDSGYSILDDRYLSILHPLGTAKDEILDSNSWPAKRKSSPTVVTPKNRPAHTGKRFLRFAAAMSQLCKTKPICLRPK